LHVVQLPTAHPGQVATAFIQLFKLVLMQGAPSEEVLAVVPQHDILPWSTETDMLCVSAAIAWSKDNAVMLLLPVIHAEMLQWHVQNRMKAFEFGMPNFDVKCHLPLL